MLGGHGSGSVQGGSVEGHPLHVGDVAGEIGQAQAIRLVWVPPVLEELLEQWGLTALRKDSDLEGVREEQDVAGTPRTAGVLGASGYQSTLRGDTHPRPALSQPNWTHPHSPT